MKAGKVILFVLAAFSLGFSFLLLLGAGGQAGSVNFYLFGFILALVGFALIFFATRIKSGDGSGDNVIVNIDLPGEVGMDTIKCQSCGGVLSEKDIKLVAGAPVATCPFCGTTYQLTEEPKW